MRSELHGDVVFGNLEGRLTDATSGTCAPKSIGTTCFEIRAPPEFASDLRDLSQGRLIAYSLGTSPDTTPSGSTVPWSTP